MNLLQSCKDTWKTLVIIVSTCLFFFSPVAIASTDNMLDVIPKEVHVENGEFTVNHPGTVHESLVVRHAIVSLPEGESGTINSIKIIGPDKLVANISA